MDFWLGKVFDQQDLEKFRLYVYPSKLATRSNALTEWIMGLISLRSLRKALDLKVALEALERP